MPMFGKKRKEEYDTSFFLNYCFRNIDNYSYHSEAQQKLSQKTKNKLLAIYQDSIGLPADAVNTTKHANDYLDARKKSLPAGVKFTETPEIANMQQTFGTLDACLKQIGGKYHPDDLNTYLQTERTNAIDQIKKQHTQDTEAVKTAITDPDKQNQMLTALAASQKTALEAFEKTLNADITALHKAAQTERDRVAIFAALRQGNEAMQKAFDSAYLKGNQQDRVSLGISGESAVFKGVSFDNMVTEVGNNFKSLTGQDISVTPSEGGYEIGLKFPAPLFSSYYSNRANNAKVDWLVAAHLMKLSGEENPQVNVDFPHRPKLALKLARDGYEALREVGYADKNITVMVNGKKYTVEELFKDAPNRKQELDARISQNAASVGSPASDQALMKQEMDAQRKTLTKPAVAPATTSPGPSLGTK